MKTTKMWLLAILFLAFAATSCSENEDPINEAQVLAEYLESPDGGGDYANTAMGAYVSAEGVKTLMATGGVYIIDVRTAETFATGHIEGAVNVPLTEVPAHLDGMDVSGYDKVAIVCYSGQSAAWVTNICRIKGYDNVFSMKWGMTSWNGDFDSWSGKTSNMYATQFKTEAYPKGAEGSLPALNTGETEGKAIMDARIDVVLAEGFGAAAIGAGDVYANPDNFYIVNYWSEAHYSDPGHIDGGMQYTPKESMALEVALKTLPTDKTIVVYCYTGQTSANLASYLRVLGYDAKSLKFGANSMIYDEMPAAQWNAETQIMDYAYVAPAPAK
jgi:rhodanese-related sulfurtransferase